MERPLSMSWRPPCF